MWIGCCLGRCGIGFQRIKDFLVIGRFFKTIAVIKTHHPRRPPVVIKGWLAAFVCRCDGCRKCRPGTRTEIGEAVIKAIGRELTRIDLFTDPARRAVVKTSFAGFFGIGKQIGVFGQIIDRFQIRGHRFDTTFGIAFNDIARDKPAFNGVIEVNSDLADIAGGLGLFPGVSNIVAPDFHDNINIALASPGQKRDDIAGQGIGFTAVAFFYDETGHGIMEQGAVIVQSGEHHRAIYFTGCVLCLCCGCECGKCEASGHQHCGSGRQGVHPSVPSLLRSGIASNAMSCRFVP